MSFAEVFIHQALFAERALDILVVLKHERVHREFESTKPRTSMVRLELLSDPVLNTFLMIDVLEMAAKLHDGVCTTEGLEADCALDCSM